MCCVLCVLCLKCVGSYHMCVVSYVCCVLSVLCLVCCREQEDLWRGGGEEVCLPHRHVWLHGALPAGLQEGARLPCLGPALQVLRQVGSNSVGVYVTMWGIYMTLWGVYMTLWGGLHHLHRCIVMKSFYFISGWIITSVVMKCSV